MKFPSLDKCIYCLENPPDSLEHIIPESIGGRFQLYLLCKNCNSELGWKIVSKVKMEPAIRLAIQNLKDEIPDLFKKMENNQIYIATDINDKEIKLKYKDSKMETIAHKLPDSSLIFDTSRISEIIAPQLEKEGLSKEEIATKLKFIQEASENELIKLTESKSIIKWSIKSILPSLEGPLLDERFIVLEAYEFLSLLLGEKIYVEWFNFIRDFIKNGAGSPNLSIDFLTTRQYQAYHKIFPKYLENETIIRVLPFLDGWYIKCILKI